jgi:cytochrome c-type biogenesis protein CcmH
VTGSRATVLLGLAAVLAAAVVVVVALARAPTATSPKEKGAAIAAELRCPTCEALSVADSPSRSAAEIRRQIAAQLEAGRTPAEVKQYFVDRYGEWILLAPASPVAWLAPPLVVAAAAAALAAWLLRGRGRERADGSAGTTSDRARDRVREEAEALDA